jgi:hypothetical protein
MKKQISVANLVMLIGGAVTFLFSFLHFIEDTSAWGTGVFPIATIAAILGLAMAVVSVMELLGTNLPGEVLTFNWKQIKFTWGAVALAITLGYFIVDKGGADTGIGMIFMLLGSIAMTAGAVMAILGKGTEMVNIPNVGHEGGSTGSSTPPPPPPPPSV